MMRKFTYAIKLSAIFLLTMVFEFSNIAPFFLVPEAYGAITPTQINQAAITTAAATQTTAVFLPVANRLYLMWTIQTIGTSPPTTPSVLCANGLSFVQVNTITFGTNATPLKRITLFRAMKSSGLSNDICTISWGQTTNGHGHVIVEYNGADTSGTDGGGAIVQSVPGSTDSATSAAGLSLTLAALQPGSVSAGGFANNINSATSLSGGFGYTAGTGVNYNTPATSLRTEWNTAGSATVNMTQSATSHIGGIAVEVRAAPPDAISYTNNSEATLNFSPCTATDCGGRVGQSVTITGTLFGTVLAGSRANCNGAPGTGCVRIANYTIPDASVTAWSDTSITFTIPAGITAFGGSGTTCGGAGSNGLCITAAGINDTGGALQFWVFPNITLVSPSGAGEGQEGASITITGTRFDTVSGTVVFQNCAGSDQTATVGVWADTSITVTVPSGISDNDDLCDIKVTRATGTGLKTNTSLNFLVLPDITTMAACSTCASNAAREFDGAGDTDGIIMLQGNHLGTGAGLVSFTGPIFFTIHTPVEGTCTTGGWAPAGTSVCIEVNNVIANTTYTGTITLTRIGDSKTDVVSFRILPQITSNAPVSGIIGDTIQIKGDHFCQSGACPISPNHSTAADNITFGSTQALDSDFQNLTGGVGACNGTGAAWIDTEMCVKVPLGTSLGSQATKITSNTSYTSNTQTFSIVSSVPNDPDVGPGAGKGQFKSDGTTAISIGGGTNQATVVFKILMSISINATLEPQVEVDPVATAFADDNIIAGTPVSYTGTPVTGLVTITTLIDGTSYHWRARVRNTDTNEFSNWTNFGGNTENPPTNPAATDFYVDSSGPVISGLCAVDPSASSCDSSSPTDIQVQIRWSTNESATEQVAYGATCPTGQASAAATFATLANKQPASPAGSGATHSQIISGLTGATSYQYMVRSNDVAGNVSYNPSTANSCNTFTTSATVTRIMKTNTFFIQTSKDTVLSNAYPKTFTIFIPESNISKTNIIFKSIIIDISGITVGTGGSGIIISPNLNSGGATAHTLADPGSGTAVSWAISYPASTISFDCPGCTSAPNMLDMSITGGGVSTVVSAKAIITYFYTP